MNSFDYQRVLIQGIHGKKISSEFLKEIIPSKDMNSLEMINIYRDDFYSRLKHILKDYYPSLCFVVGEKNFFDLAHTFIKFYPPNRETLPSHAEKFILFIRKHPISQKFTFLLDLAKFERSYHHLTLQRETSHIDKTTIDWSKITDQSYLELVDHLAPFEYSHPILSIWSSRELLTPFEEIDLSKSELFLLYKKNSKIYHTILSKIQFFILKNLLFKHHPLGLCLEYSQKMIKSFEKSEITDLFLMLMKNNLIKIIIY